MRKSSGKKFHEIITTLGCDNSMGDMNYLPFAFIDKMNLQNEFEEYLIKSLGWRGETGKKSS